MKLGFIDSFSAFRWEGEIGYVYIVVGYFLTFNFVSKRVTMEPLTAYGTVPVERRLIVSGSRNIVSKEET